MIYIETLTSKLEQYKVYSHIDIPIYSAIYQIKLLSIENALEETDNCVYFSDDIHMKSIIENNIDLNNKTIIISSEIFNYEISKSVQCNIIVFNCDRTLLFNTISDNLRSLHQIEKRLASIPVSKSHLQGFINTALSCLDVSASMIVVSPTFQIIDATQNQIKHSRNKFDNISINSYLSHKEIVKYLSFCVDTDENFSILPSTSINITIPIKDGESILGYIIFWAEEDGFAIKEILLQISNILPLFLQDERDQNISSTAKAFSKVAEYVLLSPEIDTTTLKEMMNQCPDRPGLFTRTILIDYDSNKMSLHHSINELIEIFNTNNVCLLDNKLLVWVSGKTHIEKPTFDENRFNQFLKKNNSYAVISNSAHYKVGLQTLYTQAKEILDVLPDMPYILDNRNFVYFNDIIQIYLIYMCSKHMSDHYGHDRLTYIAGPEIMGIIQYDSLHGTNNLEFLYTYISCGCNVQETANIMHMHRNTVNNHLNNISDLIGENVRDSRVANRLSISCSIMLFATKTLNQENRIIIGKNEMELKNSELKTN